jgi:hypothetical protein
MPILTNAAALRYPLPHLWVKVSLTGEGIAGAAVPVKYVFMSKPLIGTISQRYLLGSDNKSG